VHSDHKNECDASTSEIDVHARQPHIHHREPLAGVSGFKFRKLAEFRFKDFAQFGTGLMGASSLKLGNWWNFASKIW
jgi:hypothetical protein